MLEVKHISCGYQDAKIVNDISFSLNRGEILCIIGPNGCGKTTLLRGITDLLPYEGSVTLDQQEIRTMKRREISQKIALMAQVSSATYFSYTVYEAVALGRYAHQKSRFGTLSTEDKEFVDHCMEEVNLMEIKDKPITQLSGGQMQRVFLAKALAQDPELILLDEPTNHLDIRHQLELLEFLKVWSSENRRGVIGVLHDLNMVRDFADKVLLMKAGRMVAYGGSNTIFEGDALEETYGIDVKAWMKSLLEKW